MKVEVIYALKDEQILLSIEVAPGSSVQEAITKSGILAKYPQINLSQNKIGIFGRITDLKTKLRDKDRIEIYRALIADAKKIRKKRAALAKRKTSVDKK